jgi:uncharacterized protein (TIGR04255 family)
MEVRIPHAGLGNPPLRRMVCQLRFPPELGFDAHTVRPLQKALLDEYPDVATEQVLARVNVGPGEKPVEVEVKSLFVFSDPERGAKVHVAEDAIALEVTRYQRFSHFAERWERVAREAVRTLDLRRQARLGLRYLNVIQREEVATFADWQGLIADHLLAPALRVDGVLDGAAFVAQGALRLRTEHGACLFRHGFPPEPDQQLPRGYVLDMDAYDDEPKAIDVAGQLAKLAAWNHQIFVLLRSSVTDTLWATFEPEDET